MRRRICLAGAAIAAVPFVVGISVAGAATKSAPAAKPIVVKCHLSLGVVPPPGSPSVDQPPANGAQYGSIHCSGAGLGFGVEKATFKVADSGDTVGSYVQYFSSGSIRGKFDISPTEGSGLLSSSSFTSEALAGKVTVTSGTGNLAGASGKNGTLKCTSGDTVHYTCTEKLKLKH